MKSSYRAFLFLIILNFIAKCIVESKSKYIAHEQPYDTDYYGIGGWEDYEAQSPELPEECKTLQYFVLTRKCTDLYPEDIKETYNDEFVNTHTQYAVFGFVDEGVEHHFLTFHHSALFHCEQIEVVNVVNFVCKNATGSSKDVQLRHSFVKCLDHQSNMVDELLVACSPELNKSTSFTALHYSSLIAGRRSSDGHVTTVLNWRLSLACVTLAIMYFCCETFY